MSKIGKMPVQIPAGVDVTVTDGNVKVKGPKGELSYQLLDGVMADVQENQVVVTVSSDEKKNLWGLTRTLIANMVEGVTNGYKKNLIVLGVGYGAKMQGSKIILSLGFSHTIEYEPAEGVALSIDKDPKGNSMIVVEGIDKQKVGEVAAKIRSFKKPEPYKGKGIRYSDEIVKLKPGKAAK